MLSPSFVTTLTIIGAGWLEYSDYRNDIEVILGDVRDFDSVSKAMKGCKAVLHLAALIGIPYSR